MADGIDLRAAQNLYIGTGACVAAYFNNEKIWPQKEYVLPEGYTALDYIENIANGSTASADYLNTGINAANDIEIYIEYEDNYYYSASACSNYIVGARSGSNGTILMGIGGSSGSNTYNVNCNGNSVQPISNYSRTRGKKYTVDLKYSSTGLNYSVTVDEGTPYTGTLAGNITTAGVPIYIFAWNSSNIKSNTRVYKCIIKKAGQIVRYYLPCISSDNVVGLYDCANSDGTGFNSGVSTSYKFYGPGIASYLTFTSQSANNIFTYRAATTATTSTTYNCTYSDNGGLNWQTISATTGGTNFTVLNSGETIMLRASHTRYATGTSAFNRFSSSGNYKVGGNIMSLIGAGDFMTARTFSSTFAFSKLFVSSATLTDSSELYLPATTLQGSCYRNMFSQCTAMTKSPSVLVAESIPPSACSLMFSGCTSLTTAPAICATTVAVSGCGQMFRGCTSLTTAPELPATTLYEGCYQGMFSACTSLTTPPSVLPATTLAQSCYSYMFYGCTILTGAPEICATTMAVSACSYMFRSCSRLTTAPELLATTLLMACYYYMFAGCTRLNHVKCLAETGINSNNSTGNWLYSVASTGTFIKSPNTTWPRGTNGIPTNWTVTDAT